jgi:hypothetical protein
MIQNHQETHKVSQIKRKLMKLEVNTKVKTLSMKRLNNL